MIVVRLMGGMGNQMFQYAVARNLAIMNNTSVKLDLNFLLDRTERESFTFRNYDLDLFNIDGAIADESQSLQYKYYKSKIMRKIGFIKTKLFCRKYKIITEKHYHFDPKVLERGDNSYLIGFWQSYKYFSEVEKEIKKDFSFKNEMGEKAKEMLKEINDKESICVNIRRGDYVEDKKALKHHGVCGLDYYKEAKILVDEKIKKPHYFIFSDDIQWCLKNIDFGENMTFVNNEYAGDRFSDKFRLMKNCKHFIIPNSSYAWWAAWLSKNEEKLVIAPKKWLADSSINTDDVTPPNWVRI